VHLADWPDAAALPHDDDLVADRDRVRDACSTGLALREAHKLRIRLPLAKATIAGRAAERLRPHAHLIADELNVKVVEFSTDLDAWGRFQIQVDAKALGPKLGPQMKDVLAATRSGDWELLPEGRARVGPRVLEAGEFDLRLEARAGVASAALPTNDMVVVLDVDVTPELRDEGMARDVVRLVQQARKDAGLHVADRIAVTLELSDAVRAAVQKHEAYLREQTLAEEVHYGRAAGPDLAEGKVEGEAARLSLARK
jgi:isoleucyl-tRNA synthetase